MRAPGRPVPAPAWRLSRPSPAARRFCFDPSAMVLEGFGCDLVDTPGMGSMGSNPPKSTKGRGKGGHHKSGSAAANSRGGLGDGMGDDLDDGGDGEKNLVKGPWSASEDTMLRELVQEHGPKRWSMIASKLPGRIGKQVAPRPDAPRPRPSPLFPPTRAPPLTPPPPRSVGSAGTTT